MQPTQQAHWHKWNQNVYIQSLKIMKQIMQVWVCQLPLLDKKSQHRGGPSHTERGMSFRRDRNPKRNKQMLKGMSWPTILWIYSWPSDSGTTGHVNRASSGTLMLNLLQSKQLNQNMIFLSHTDSSKLFLTSKTLHHSFFINAINYATYSSS